MNGSNEHQAAALAGRVRRARKSREWTQADVAELAGVAPGTVNRIENALPVRPGNLRAILDVLDLEIEPIQPTAEGFDDISIAKDLVEKHLLAIPGNTERHEAFNRLIRFLTMGRN
jgi:transcriptional regulator with XRE-family HTH domain